MSDKIFIMHFRQFQPENCDTKYISLTTGNWFDKFDCESCDTCFSKQSF